MIYMLSGRKTSSVKPKDVAYSSEVVVTTFRLFKSEKMDSLLILVMPVMIPQSPIDEQIVYNQLKGNEGAIWSLLLASGYLKVLSYEDYFEIPEDAQPEYELTLTNLEVRRMFQSIVLLSRFDFQIILLLCPRS